MSWIRMDDGFAEHPKLSSLTDREFRVWCRMIGYCARVEDPTIDTITVANVQGLTQRLVTKFATISLLDSVGKQHEIHDWIHYQPKDKTGAERQARYRSRMAQTSQTSELSTVTQTVTKPLLARAITRPGPSSSKEQDLKEELQELEVPVMTAAAGEAPREKDIRAVAARFAADYATVEPLARVLESTVFADVALTTAQRCRTGNIGNPPGLLVKLLRSEVKALHKEQVTADAPNFREMLEAEAVGYARGGYPWEVGGGLIERKLTRLNVEGAERQELLLAARAVYDEMKETA